MRRALVAIGALAIGVAIAACKKKPVDAPPPTSSAAPSSSVPQTPLDQASTEEAWVEARDGDPMELMRLADALGADELASVAINPQANPDDRLTAIRALAFVDDATPALDALTAIATSPLEQRSTPALETLAEIAPVRAPIEEQDASAWGRCAEKLLAGIPSDGPRRAFAIRALLGMADRGAIDPARIPAS